MDFHDKEFFERLMTITEENNHLLHKMVRGARIARIARITYWVIVLGISIGAYYYVQPYIDQITSVFGGFMDNISSFQQIMGSLRG